MAKRYKVGLSYTYNENWIGGTYYIENLISALDILPDEQKPHIILITNNQRDFKTASNRFSYPYLSFQLGSGERNRLFQLINKISSRLFRARFFNQQIMGMDAVFPYYASVQQSSAQKRIYWIPDFQEHFAPAFFSREAIDARVKDHLQIQASEDHLVVSSNDAAQHFSSLYPRHRVKVHVLPFAVTHPSYRQLDITALLEKFSLPSRYFICPNQFWTHKNQLVVLKALKLLKSRGVQVTIAFTGKTDDYRNPEYFEQLLAYAQDNELGDRVRFLGFIDRQEQLQLMNHAHAVVQPSLFEGWSTVVEDAKAMNKALIVSAISVHREQLPGSSALFFNPLDEAELADVLHSVTDHQTLPGLYDSYDYLINIREFGRKFIAVVSGQERT